MDEQKVSPETLAAQGLGEADPVSGGLAPVINLSTNYEQAPDGSYRQGRVYTRADNPTSEHAEQLLAALEGGALAGGCACALFGSGMAAATAVFQSLLPGDHVLVSRVLYWGVRKWLAEFALTWGLDVEFTDTGDLAAVAAAIRPGRTRLLWVETPANPMWEITDLAAVCDLAHAAGVRVAVDNTVATPVLTRPFEFGANLVVHSATKYLNGHGDVLAGAVLAARRDPFWERIRSWRRNAGAMPGPFEAWLLQRGMRTLFLRVHRASQTGRTSPALGCGDGRILDDLGARASTSTSGTAPSSSSPPRLLPAPGQPGQPGSGAWHVHPGSQPHSGRSLPAAAARGSGQQLRPRQASRPSRIA